MNKPCKNPKLCLAKEIIFRKSPEVLGINPIGFLSKEPRLMPTSRFSYKNIGTLKQLHLVLSLFVRLYNSMHIYNLRMSSKQAETLKIWILHIYSSLSGLFIYFCNLVKLNTSIISEFVMSRNNWDPHLTVYCAFLYCKSSPTQVNSHRNTSVKAISVHLGIKLYHIQDGNAIHFELFVFS